MNRMLALLQERFIWPKMAEDVRVHIRSCDRCMRFKQPQQRFEMKSIKATCPSEMAHLDFLTIGSKSNENKNINVLMDTDHFTKYACAYITPKQTTAVVAKTLWENFLVN